jgi:glutamine amidotransferase
MGWNNLTFPKESRLFAGIPEGVYVYFVHSYYLYTEKTEIAAARTHYGADIVASVEWENIFACQFHPEKSGKWGLKILENFLSLS